MFYLGYKYGMNKVLSRFESTNDIIENLAERLNKFHEIDESEEKKFHDMIKDIDQKSKQIQKDKNR